MKSKSVAFLMIVVFILFLSCFEPSTQENGTLQFQTTINEDLAKTISDTCNITDLIWRFASFEVSTGRIVEGEPDNLEWISVYTDTMESRLSEFQFEAELPPGTYRSIRLAVRNRNWWEVSYSDSFLIVEDWNRGTDYRPDDTPYSYYDSNGCWYNDSGDSFINVAPQESIADIIVVNDGVINVTMNWNLFKISFDEKADSDSLIATGWFIRNGHDMIEWNVSYTP